MLGTSSISEVVAPQLGMWLSRTDFVNWYLMFLEMGDIEVFGW
jgi:hypothetical protein